MTMSIQFVVETGTASATGTSYATVAQYQQFWLNRGVTITDTEAQIQGYLNQATQFIDTNYKFRGDKRYVTTQPLEWPRILANPFGESWNFLAFRMIAVDEIPVEVIKATCYLAYEAKQGLLFLANEKVRSRSYGPVSTSYSTHEGDRSYPFVDSLFRYLVSSETEIVRVN